VQWAVGIWQGRGDEVSLRHESISILKFQRS
jgi:hypothetical protein